MIEPVKLHVTGKSKYGKSYFNKNVLLPELAKHKPVIVFDRKGEYAGPRAKDVPEKWPQFDSVFKFFEFLESKKGKIKPGVYVITCRSDSDWLYGFSFFNALADSQLPGGIPVTLVIEEAHQLLQANDFSKAKEILIQLARHGRHENLGLVLISQRTLDVITDIRSQLDGYISFYQALQADVDALKKNGHLEAEKILDLKKREYVSFGEIPEHLKAIKKGALI